MACPSHTSPQDINLDCLSAKELEPFIHDQSKPPQFREYALAKQTALIMQKREDLVAALSYEEECQRIFPTIPEAYQW